MQKTHHSALNFFHTILLVVGMLALLALLGWLLAGTQGLFWGTVLSVIVVTLGQEVSPPVILRIYGAVPLTVQETPLLHQIVKTLARRADLPVPPQLYYIPSQTMNAIAVGRRKAPAIGITDGLLRNLNGRELTGVLAHEIGHFRNNDMRVMATADAISRITNLFSSLGIFMLFINIPLHLMGASTISWLAIMLLLITPTLSNLLQMALSRTREYNADRQAVQLTSDAHGLISALLKLKCYSVNILTTMLMPGHGTPDPFLFRTHPSTQERVAQLRILANSPSPQLPLEDELAAMLPQHLPPVTRRPQWHVLGIWY